MKTITKGSAMKEATRVEYVTDHAGNPIAKKTREQLAFEARRAFYADISEVKIERRRQYAYGPWKPFIVGKKISTGRWVKMSDEFAYEAHSKGMLMRYNTLISAHKK